MSSTGDKVKGYTDKAVGKTKEKLGNAIGSDRLQSEGVVQTIKGKVEVGIGKAKDTPKKVVNDL